ncbi:hypothetical protein B0T10DRAFT_406929 [Thelonectria olida]|uniref:Xylanolytic transcriptional activator regulatory domain-containing protein n=1 Tax=Thelonectria olida TaxID=1576542 RepID=A0A9P8W095_9HYPO|nr:hypothetical protein B0T10DRAFT_406929 [Thelonectria olida]
MPLESHGNLLPAPNQPNLEALSLRLTEFRDSVAAGLQWIQSHQDTGHFLRRIFGRLPAKRYVVEITERRVEEPQVYGILFTTESFLRLVDEQYAAGVENQADNPARWAIVNAMVASAMVGKITNESLADMTPTVWCYFKNAFSTFSELIIQKPHVSTCEAVLAMAMYMLCSADGQTASQLTAAATRLVHMLGFHRRQYYVSVDSAVAQRHKRVFWICYVLDADLMHRYGLPSAFGNGEPAVGFPDDGRTEGQQSGFLRERAELAVIQHRIHKLLQREDVLLQSGMEILETVADTTKELWAWKDALSERMPRFDSSTAGFAMSLTLLHYTCYSSMAKIQMVLVRLRGPEYSDSAQARALKASGIQMPWNMLVASARGIIGLLRNLHVPPFAYVWGTLCYPLSAVLILLSAILEDPVGAQAQADVGTIREFVQFLTSLRDDGCDVGSLLGGCTKLHRVAACAVHTHKGEDQSLIHGDESASNGTLAQLQSIRLKLLRVTDWLHLAQGLLSNIPMLRAEAETVLSGIFGSETVDNVYGLFVPEIFKSCNYNFSFSK